MQYLFILGSTPLLSQKELESLLGEKSLEKIAPNVLKFDNNEGLDLDFLINRLGGVVKIASLEKVISDKINLLKEITALLVKRGESKIIFGTSIYGNFFLGNLKAFNKEIKGSLEKIGKRARFVLGEKAQISSVQIEKIKVNDIILVNNGNKIFIGITLKIQNFEEWGKRDYRRPFADPKSGMLPPKVARMMLNIALGQRPINSAEKSTILDPFCGVGTIGAEALTIGCWVISSDKGEEAVKKTQKNLQWISDCYGISEENFKVLNSDAKNVSEMIPQKSIDAIVTEPYLGPKVELWRGRPTFGGRKITIGKLQRIINELENLYMESLASWNKILKDNGKVCIVFPLFKLLGESFSMKKVIDSCEKLGYNTIIGPIEYGHPQSFVKRQIYLLEQK